MNRSHKIFLSIFITFLILSGVGVLGYEVLEMGLNSSPAQAMRQPSNIKANFIHQLFADITPAVPTSTTAIVANARLNSEANAPSSNTTQSDTLESTLHFASQHDALKFAMKKFSPTELVSLMNDFTHPDQVTPQQVEELKQKIKSRFTQEELLALKEALDTK